MVAIHAQESKKASREKAKAVVAQLREMKLKKAAKKVEDGVEETLTYCGFHSEHWTRIRPNGLTGRSRHCTRVVGAFPDGNSALMLVCARLRHVAGTRTDRLCGQSICYAAFRAAARLRRVLSVLCRICIFLAQGLQYFTAPEPGVNSVPQHWHRLGERGAA